MKDLNTPFHFMENKCHRVLSDRVLVGSCVLDKISRLNGTERTVSRLVGFERCVNKPAVGAVGRFEDKFPHRQENLIRNDNKQAQCPNHKMVRSSTKEQPIRLSCSCNEGIQQPLPQRSSQREKLVKDQEPMPEESWNPSNLPNVLEKVQQNDQRRHSHVLKTTKEVSDDVPGHLNNNARTVGVQRSQIDKTLCVIGTVQSPLKPISMLQEILPEKAEQQQVQSRNGLQQAPERYEKLPISSQDQRSQARHLSRDPALLQKAAGSQSYPAHEMNVDEPHKPQIRQCERNQHHETQDRITAQVQKHVPCIRETSSLVQGPEQLCFPQKLNSIHVHETKLILRQQFLQEKVKSRKMLLGSVIPSDLTFSSEACRNWQSASTLYHRYSEEKSYQHMVLSADSGISVGEGSSASRRNSETETDDQTRDDLPTIIADMGEIVNRRVPSKCLRCQRAKCETKDASSQHSRPPSEAESQPSSQYTESISSATMELTALNVMSPPPPNRIHQCRVIRDKNTYGTLFYPVYRMYLEREGRPELLLLTARKRKKCSTSRYLICTGDDELRRKSSSLVGKLRSNLIGTQFYLASYVKGFEADSNGSPPRSPLKIDSLLLFYETNILGTKGPRRMKVFLPEVGRDDGHRNLLDRVRDGPTEGVLTLVNKEPEWDRETLSHILYFEGRVTKSSVKNFQLVQPPDEASVLLQFGKIGRNEFTLDYHPPINAVQAFAIALSSFDGKIACE